MKDLLYRPLTEVTALLARKEISPVELMRTTLERIRETIDWYQSNATWVAGIKTKDYLSYYEKQYGKAG